MQLTDVSTKAMEARIIYEKPLVNNEQTSKNIVVLFEREILTALDGDEHEGAARNQPTRRELLQTAATIAGGILASAALAGVANSP